MKDGFEELREVVITGVIIVIVALVCLSVIKDRSIKEKEATILKLKTENEYYD